MMLLEVLVLYFHQEDIFVFWESKTLKALCADLLEEY